MDRMVDRFLGTFANKGWNTVTYALSFRYKEGLLIDYAMKKERLLLDMNKDIDSKTLIALIATGLPEFILNKLGREEYKMVFAKDKYDIGTVKDYEARIDLLVDKYCNKRPYRCTIEDKKEIEEQIAKLLEKNLIEESYSPFAAPVTLAYRETIHSVL